jgi:HSP20 family protein
MTFYVQSYPYRRLARQWAENRDREQTLGVNVRAEEDAFVLTALVPGIQADELNIQVFEDVVQLKADYRRSSPVDKADENGSYLIHELPAGSFTRTLRLPTPIDTDHVEAEVMNGVLTLRLPKAESARPKQIKIKSS